MAIGGQFESVSKEAPHFPSFSIPTLSPITNPPPPPLPLYFPLSPSPSELFLSCYVFKAMPRALYLANSATSRLCSNFMSARL